MYKPLFWVPVAAESFKPILSAEILKPEIVPSTAASFLTKRLSTSIFSALRM